MKKGRFTSIITLLMVVAVVAVVLRRQHREEEPAVAMSTPNYTVPVEATSPQTEKVTYTPGTPGEHVLPDLKFDRKTLRVVVRAAPVPIGPLRGALTIYDTMQGD